MASYRRPPYQICLVGDDQHRLVAEQRLDVVVQRDLLLDTVAAGLRDINEKQHDGLQMRQSCDGLHLDRVALFQRMIQDT